MAYQSGSKALRLPSCHRCKNKGLTCLEGSGKACYECNRYSAACNDWDSDKSGRTGSALVLADDEISVLVCYDCCCFASARYQWHSQLGDPCLLRLLVSPSNKCGSPRSPLPRRPPSSTPLGAGAPQGLEGYDCGHAGVCEGCRLAGHSDR